MADPIIPPGAFAAMKAGQPFVPGEAAAPAAPKAAKAEPVKAVPKEVAKAPPKEAPPPPQVEAPTPAEKKIWKLKADGEEFDFDASDEEAIKREIMKARGADKRFQTAAQLKKQAESFFEMLKSPESLKKVLTDPRIGVDLKKFAEDYVWEHIQEQQMTPEQKAQREKDRRLAELEAKEAQYAKNETERILQEKQKMWEGEYEKKFLQALETEGIPKTEQVVREMAYYTEKALENGYDLSPQEIARLVQNDLRTQFSQFVNGLNEEQFLQFVGEHNAEKLRKADIKRLKSPQGNPFPKPPRQERPKPQAAERDKRVPASVWIEDIKRDFLNRHR